MGGIRKMNAVLIEYIIMTIIQEHQDLNHAINQHKITAEINKRVGVDDFINPRTVRNMIENLIKNGSPIISSPHSPGGYCWGGGEGEALECVNRLRRKGIKILLRARWTKRNIKRGQGRLF